MWHKPGDKESQQGNTLTTKAGIPLYGGTAADFLEWEFRVRAKHISFADRDDQYSQQREMAAKVLDGLYGDALRTVMDLGLDRVIHQDGIPLMIETIRCSIEGKKFLESKELYREGAKLHGPLSRQRGEPMHSYISRRRLWYKKLTDLDTEYKLPDKLLTDMLLENSNLSENQQLMITNAIKTGGSVTFDKVAE